MAYNPYMSAYPYSPAQMPGYPQYSMQQTQPLNTEPPKQQIQYSVVNAPSIEYAQNYPVAPGNSVSFKIENQPFLCTKTMGFSPLEKPVFETYRLVKEDKAIEPETSENKPEYALKTDLETIEKRLDELEKSMKPKRKTKAEDTTDDAE